MSGTTFGSTLGMSLSGKDALSGETTVSELFCLSYENRSTLKRMNLLPLGANSLLFKWILFRRDSLLCK